MLLKTLADFAKSIRSFLGFASLIVLALLALFIWLFSEGSFNSLISNFDRLNPNQFFWFGIVALGMIFIILFCLIFLSYKGTKQTLESTTPLFLSVIVHETNDKTKGIEEAVVTLALSPESKTKLTDHNGNAIFSFEHRHLGKSFDINAIKNSYLPRNPRRIRLKNGERIFLPLELNHKTTVSQKTPEIDMENFERLLAELPEIRKVDFHNPKSREWRGKFENYVSQLPQEPIDFNDRYHRIVWNTRHEDTPDQRTLYHDSCDTAEALLKQIIGYF